MTAYLKTSDGQEFYGYGIIFLSASYSNYNVNVTSFKIDSWGEANRIVVNERLKKALLSNTYPKPPKGSKVCLRGDNPFAVADIRKNYTITRLEDKADYVVGFPKEVNYSAGLRRIVIFPKIKIITAAYFFGDTKITKDKIIQLSKDAISHIYSTDMLEDAIFYEFPLGYYLKEDEEILKNLLGVGAYSAKTTTFSNLDMSSADDVTFDSLKILKNVIIDKQWTITNEESARMALMTFHNFNYRNVPGTIDRFFKILYNNSNLLREMSRHESRFPKPIKELLQYGAGTLKFKDENDFNLYYDFMESLMEVGKGKVVGHNDYDNKVTYSPVAEDMFQEMYDVKVRITPKKYEDFISAKQDGNSAC